MNEPSLIPELTIRSTPTTLLQFWIRPSSGRGDAVTNIEQRRSDGGTNLSPLSVDPNKPVAKPLKHDE
jgi:hypothetical protein